MRKKFILYNFLAMSISLLVLLVTSFLIIFFSNIKENKKEIKNTLFKVMQKYEKNNFAQLKENVEFIDISLRVTIISESGIVIYDSKNQNTAENLSDRKELQNLGKVYLRYSETEKKKKLYVASFVEGHILRLSKNMQQINNKVYFILGLIFLEFSFVYIANLLAGLIYSKKAFKKFITSLSKINVLVNDPMDYNLESYSNLDNQLGKIKDKIENQVQKINIEKSKLQDVINFISFLVLVVDKQGEVILINKQAESVFNIKYKDNINDIYLSRSNIKDIILKDDIKENTEVVIQDVNYLVEKRNIQADWIDDGTIITLHDITSRKVLENTKKEFFSNASHELKSPLTVVRGYLEMIDNNIITKKQEIDKTIKTAISEINHMANLINSMLDISILENKTNTKLSKCILKDIIEETLFSLNEKIKAKKINVSKKLDNSDIIINKTHLEILIRNLLDNAIKYNKDKGTISIALTKGHLVIKDSGIGIKEEEKERVFERFYRAEDENIKKTPGSGLGLSIVKHVCNLYNITLKIDSKENEYTKVSLYFDNKKNAK